MATSTATREAVWLRKLLAGLFAQIPEPAVIHSDNQSCVQMSMNPVFYDKSKHIQIQYHFIRDMVQKGAVELQYIPTYDHTVDIITEPLSRFKFEYFRGRLGVEGPQSIPPIIHSASNNSATQDTEQAHVPRLYISHAT